MKRRLLLLFLLVMSVFVVSNAQAQTADEGPLFLSVTSEPIRLTIAPGESKTTSVFVKNNGTKDEMIVAEVLKFAVTDDSTGTQLLEPEPEDDFIEWLSLSEEGAFEVKQGEKKVIEATFDIPEEAAFAYYYAITFSRFNPEAIEINSNSSAVVGKTAVLALIAIDNPDARLDISLTDFTTSKKIYEYLPAEFFVKYENNGNVHVAPVGNIFLYQGDKEVGLIDINASSGSVLPGSSRTYNAIWDEGFPLIKTYVEDGKEKTKTEYDMSTFGNFRFGRYRAEVFMVYFDGERDVPLEDTLTFWVIPWKVLLILSVFILMIGYSAFSMIRGIGRKARRKK